MSLLIKPVWLHLNSFLTFFVLKLKAIRYGEVGKHVINLRGILLQKLLSHTVFMKSK